MPPAAAVSKAELWLYGSAPNNPNLALCQILQPWDEATVSKASHPTVNALYLLPAIPQGPAWVVTDVTALYKLWKDGTANYGIELKASSNVNTAGQFISSDNPDAELRPKLFIYEQ